uniref:CCHC-type domain-containing protein n=1 Tax=Tanacetum cinerariifolium TaxID=118510 RepID=A0A699GSK2_TANCI|nr:hypothetical protein [Tanacetum cinerariifolium]
MLIILIKGSNNFGDNKFRAVIRFYELNSIAINLIPLRRFKVMKIFSIMHAVATTSVQYCFKKTDPESIVLAASMRVLFVWSVPEPFSLFVDLNIKSSKYKLAEDKFNFSQLKTSSASVLQELQFSLVGKSKLNDVDLLLEAEMKCFSSRSFTRREKYCLMSKGIKQISLRLKSSKDIQDSPDDEEDTRSSQEYLNDLKKEFHEVALLAKSKRFFKKGSQRFSGAKATDETQCHKCGRRGHFARDYFSNTSGPSYSSLFQNNTQPKFFNSSQQKPEPRPTKDFEAKFNKVKAKLALLSSSASASKSSMVKNNGLAEFYEWDEEDVSSDDNEMVEVKVLMKLVDVSKESSINGKWVNISIRKHVSTKILKENQKLRKELKELTEIILSWLNSSIKVNQLISEQIPTQKIRFLRLDQLIEEPSSSRKTNLVFVNSSVDDTNVSTPTVERPWLFEAEGFMLPNHDTRRIVPYESQVKVTDPLVIGTDSSVSDYDSADESSVCNTPLLPLEKLAGAEPVFQR